MINLKEKPFNLSEEDIKWVNETIGDMTIEEKIGQLFFNMGSSMDEKYLKDTISKYHIGGIRYNPATAEMVHFQNKTMQENSKVPIIIACNTESGGVGACKDGTFIADQVKIGATGNAEYAYRFGQAANKEARAIGCNLSFAPVCDINRNWRNPIISNRTYGSDTDLVTDMSVAYMKGAQTNPNFGCAAKHFPGDGVDERDQHVSPSVNTYGCDEWMNSFGKVYKALISEGLNAIMVGHISLPSWQKKINPSLEDKDIRPAPLSKELLGGLLRDELGFNGMILTDASHMVGLTCEMKRADMLPATIAAGCDMFLFFNDMDEDYESMMNGYKNGVITDERLTEALQRILGLKASLGLHSIPKNELVGSFEDAKKIIGCDEHIKLKEEICAEGITLVKNTQDVLPITPEKYKRILIVPVKGLSAGGMFSMMRKNEGKEAHEILKEKLEKQGFEVTIYVDPIKEMQAKMAKLQAEAEFTGNSDKLKQEMGKGMNAYFAGKTPIKGFVEKQDLVITLSNVKGQGAVVERVAWGMTKGGGEIPWYVHELPVLVISTAHPFLLADVPYAKTYINAYDAEPATLNSIVDKLCGKEEFKGKDPINAFCDIWGTQF